MSVYSNGNFKSVIIDPTNYRANHRAEWKLDGARIFKSDLRLGNVGVTTATNVATNANNKLAGVGSILKSVRLLDGKTELDSVNDFNRYYGFQQLLDQNSKNQSKNRYLINNNQGLSTGEVDKKLINLKPQKVITDTESTTPEGLIDLRDILPLLRSLDFLDASQSFKNLRLQVEFEADDRLKMTNTTSASTTLEPVLFADVIEDPALVAGMLKQMPTVVEWDTIEHDVLSVPDLGSAPAVTSSIQPISKKVRGFDNKTVKRLLAIKTFTDKNLATDGAGVVNDVGDMGSIAGYDEVFNVRVNGKNILSRKGNEAPNARMAMVVDAYGDFASYFGSNLIDINGADEIVNDGEARLGRLDYFGIVINDMVKDLQFSYDRTSLSTDGSTDTRKRVKANRGLDIHLHAEVSKVLTIGANGYNVAYV